MILVNFSHPMTGQQLQEAEAIIGGQVSRLVEVKVHLEQGLPFEDQVRTIVEQASLTSAEWQTAPVLVNPPSLSPITAALLAELHGRMGYFPPVLRLRPVAGMTPPRFEVAEVLRLQEIRDRARAGR
jgi:hypothetical protein